MPILMGPARSREAEHQREESHRSLRYVFMFSYWVAATLTLSELILHAIAPGHTEDESGSNWFPHQAEASPGHAIPLDLTQNPDSSTTIVFIGDSFVAGQGVKPEYTISRQLERHFRARNQEIKVLGHAKPGWNLGEQQEWYAAVSERLAADIVIWVMIPNDLGVAIPDHVGDLISHRTEVPQFPRLFSLVRRQFDAVHQTNAVLQSYRTALARAPALEQLVRALVTVNNAVSTRGANFYVAMFPLLHDLHRYPLLREQIAITESLRDNHIKTIDLHSCFKSMDASRLWVSSQDHHPNRIALHRATKCISEAIEVPDSPTDEPQCDLVKHLGLNPSRTFDACHLGVGESLLQLADTLASTQNDPRAVPANLKGLANDFTSLAHIRKIAQAHEAAD